MGVPIACPATAVNHAWPLRIRRPPDLLFVLTLTYRTGITFTIITTTQAADDAVQADIVAAGYGQ